MLATTTSPSEAARERPAPSIMDEAFPRHDTATVQTVLVEAPAQVVFDAVHTADIARSRTVMLLAAVRELPDRLLRRLRRRPHRSRRGVTTIDDLVNAGYWAVIGERPGDHLLLGLVMWDPDLTESGASVEHFLNPPSGAVRVGWGFTVTPLGSERSLLTTETRTAASDDRARRRFRLYWAFIKPFAALTRRFVLDRIRDAAEGTSRAAPPAARPRMLPGGRPRSG